MPIVCVTTADVWARLPPSRQVGQMAGRLLSISSLVAAMILLGSCAYVSLNMGRAEPLAPATRAKALGSFPVQGACAIYNPMAGGVTFNPLSTDGSNIDDPSSMGCAAQLEFTPDGAGLLVTVGSRPLGSRLQSIDWRTGKVVWSRMLVPESGYGWSVDKQWLVVSEEYGAPERACWPFFEGEAAQFCDPKPRKRVRPQTLDPASGLAVDSDGVAEAQWSPSPYHFGVATLDFGSGRRLVDLRAGMDIPLKVPGDHVATAEAMPRISATGQPGVWLGPTDFDTSLSVSLWLRLVPDGTGTNCINPPAWAMEVAAYRDGAPVWSRRVPCASRYPQQAGAWHSVDGQYVGVSYPNDARVHGSLILDAASGEPVSGVTPLVGLPYSRLVVVPTDSPLTRLAGYRIGPVTSETGLVAMLAYDPERGVPFRFAYVGDIASGEIIARHDFGVDEESDGRYPSLAISRDGKLLALSDTTGTVTVVPSGAP